MASIDTRPKVVDIAHYAGDTLTIRVNVSDVVVAGREWSAQVRALRDGTLDAEFLIQTDELGAWLTLPEAETRRLANGGELVRATRGRVLRYTGDWDVQVAPVGGGDPVTTFAQGKLTIDLDVTREEP
jgi:hypothetical protein